MNIPASLLMKCYQPRGNIVFSKVYSVNNPTVFWCPCMGRVAYPPPPSLAPDWPDMCFDTRAAARRLPAAKKLSGEKEKRVYSRHFFHWQNEALECDILNMTSASFMQEDLDFLLSSHAFSIS